MGKKVENLQKKEEGCASLPLKIYGTLYTFPTFNKIAEKVPDANKVDDGVWINTPRRLCEANGVLYAIFTPRARKRREPLMQEHIPQTPVRKSVPRSLPPSQNDGGTPRACGYC